MCVCTCTCLQAQCCIFCCFLSLRLLHGLRTDARLGKVLYCSAILSKVDFYANWAVNLSVRRPGASGRAGHSGAEGTAPSQALSRLWLQTAGSPGQRSCIILLLTLQSFVRSPPRPAHFPGAVLQAQSPSAASRPLPAEACWRGGFAVQLAPAPGAITSVSEAGSDGGAVSSPARFGLTQRRPPG